MAVIFPLNYDIGCPVLVWDLQGGSKGRIALQWLLLQLLDLPVAVSFGTAVDWWNRLAFDLKGWLALIFVLRYFWYLHDLSLVLFPLMLSIVCKRCDSPLIKISKWLFLCLLLLQLLQALLRLVLRIFYSFLKLFDEVCLWFVGEFEVTDQRSESIIDESSLTSDFMSLTVLVHHGWSFNDDDACLKLSPTHFSGRSARLSCSPTPGYPPYRTAASSLHRSFPSLASFPNSIKIQYNQRCYALWLDSVDKLCVENTKGNNHVVSDII